jgi:hypothetical protein
MRPVMMCNYVLVDAAKIECAQPGVNLTQLSLLFSLRKFAAK